MKSSITNIQQARAIISEVGELYQQNVVDMLRSLTYYPKISECKRNAQKVIGNMEREYVLNLANILWKDKYEEISQYVKNYS